MKRWSFRVEPTQVVSAVASVGLANVVVVVDMGVTRYSWETGLV